ncbi:MAG: 30S ribosomal protein S4 [Rickettsiaceae bacterium]|nr:30S ribosomal protein S4 [Rickettsiaceae bacterium]
MTKIVNAKYKASRRLGVTIWGDGKDPFNKRNYRPGQQGPTSMSKISDYGLHLRAKQRLKAHYGRINERQFRNTFKEASRRKGNTGENFLAMLESRLDVAVYRMTLASSIFAARQLVSHKHILVNGRSVNIPSYMLQVGDIIELKSSAKESTVILGAISKGERRIPDYYNLDTSDMKGKLLRMPTVSDIPFPFEAEVHLIIEFYSK